MALIPVDHDPFADDGAVSSGALIPVDHDPFAQDYSPVLLATAAPASGWLDSAARLVTGGLSDAAAAAGGATGLALRRATDPAAASPGASWLGDYQRLLAERTGDQPSLADLAARKQQAIAQREQQLGRPLTLSERLNAVPIEQDPDMMIALGFALGPEGAAAARPEQMELPLRMPGITAYHGSAADFPAFSSDYIGTGEGAQVYSHGLYFAGKEKTGKEYRQALAPNFYRTTTADPRVLRQSAPGGLIAGGDAWTQLFAAAKGAPGLQHPDQAQQIARNVLQGIDETGSIDRYADEYELPSDEMFGPAYQAAVSRAKELGLSVNPGRMYQVNLDVDPKALLDWDRPISEQPQPVIDALKRYREQGGYIVNPEDRPDWTGDQMYQHMIDQELSAPERQDRAPIVAQRLRESGLQGVQYLDAGSRHLPPDDPTASRNYVIFDDKLIDILKKYGLGALIAGGASAIAGNANAATHAIPVDYDPFASAPLPLQ